MEDEDVDGRIFKWALKKWECRDLTKLVQDRGKCPAVVSSVTK